MISSAWFCISISRLSVLPKETSCIQEQSCHLLAGRLNSRAKFYLQAKLPVASARGRNAYLKAKPGLECVIETNHFSPREAPGPTASFRWPAGCGGEAVLTPSPCPDDGVYSRSGWAAHGIVGEEGKAPVKFSLQPVFSPIWKNHCNSSHLVRIRMTNMLQRQ